MDISEKKKAGLSQQRAAALEATREQIRKSYGKEALVSLDQDSAHASISGICTGSIGLNKALGGAGIPRGRVVEIFGHEASGKTTLALHTMANAQREGGHCVFIDVEHALDINLARRLGVILEQTEIAQPTTGEEALDVADKFIRSGAADVIVIDSVAALMPEAELKGEMGDVVMGGQARLMSQGLRKIIASMSKNSETIVIFINQIRSKIGVVFGNPETTTGGVALKYYASVRLEVKRRGLIKRGETNIGQEVEVKVCKNKVASPFQTASFELIWGEGINRLAEIIDLAVQKNIIGKSGAWFKWQDKNIAQGRDNLIQYFKDNPSVAEQIEKLVLQNITLIQEN